LWKLARDGDHSYAADLGAVREGMSDLSILAPKQHAAGLKTLSALTLPSGGEKSRLQRAASANLKLLRTREKIGDAGDVPARSARRRDLAFVERTRDRSNAQDAFGLNGA